jgi:signal transduction histidine kinase
MSRLISLLPVLARPALLRHTLMAAVFLCFAVSLWAAYLNLRAADGAIRSRLAENAVWAAAQVQTELARFRGAVQTAAASPGIGNAEAVMQRFDLFWSRIGVLQSGDLAAFLAAENLTGRVVALRGDLERLDPLVAAARDRASFEAVAVGIESLWPKSQALAAAIMQAEKNRVAAVIRQREEAIQYVSLSLIGLLVTGVVSLISLTLSLRRARAAETRATAARDRLTAAVETMSDGFALVDGDGAIRLMNSRFTDLFGGADGDDFSATTGLPAQPTGPDPTMLALAGGRRAELRVRPVAGDGLVCLACDVTERELWLAETEAARVAAETSNAAKSRFLAMMSHEIRTPLNGVLGLLETLTDEALPATARRQVDIALRSAGTLRTVIDDLLDASKIEAGELRLSERDFAPSILLGETCDLLRPNARAAETTVIDRVVGPMPEFVCGDPDRVRQVLANLVGNAIKFTQGGTVDVSLSADRTGDGRDVLTFQVRDTGVGISAAHQGDVFRPFHQIDSGYARKFGGTGLGLAISKALVEAMDGTIGFSSTAGQGSTFWFQIPLRPATSNHRQTAATRPVQPDTSDLRVLLVEDSETNRFVARSFLRSVGIEVEEAVNGAIAVDKVGACRYDLVLMDVAMPVMDGIEATKRIRSLSAVPIIGLSAHAFEDEIQRCRDAGMDDYLAKPVGKRTLVDTVIARAAHKGSVAQRIAC